MFFAPTAPAAISKGWNCSGFLRFFLLNQGETTMGMTTPKDGAPGTTDQSPRWEGPKGNRPRGYLKAKDDPDKNRDANDENNRDPEMKDFSDAMKQKGE
jgi:hypothetical protein